MTIKIRIAQLEDLEPLAELFNAYREFYEETSDIGLARRFLQDRLNNKDSIIFVAETASNENQAQKLIGFCQLYPTFCSVLAAPICVLYDLFVDVNIRKSGAGKALMLTAHEYAANNGYVRLDLTTAKTNLTAQSLYESLGWVRDDVFYTYNKTITPAKLG
ncbi:GNAT family N-acetyltransferase [Methylotenera sp.]|uniref:GNAT family N-acetyltransferase n=1 Tax=Methylotenera sp. TaxID=2051956 RepID=UPI00248A838F|nr:GNAT family N-acetyltransferase [Methylotenera sp.]MDI1361414.1 GNAT family N-acetyltransferase [Methylotenera sp.]